MSRIFVLFLVSVLLACGQESDQTMKYPIPVEADDMAEYFLEDAANAYDKYVGKRIITSGDIETQAEGYSVISTWESLGLKCMSSQPLGREDQEVLISGTVEGIELTVTDRYEFLGEIRIERDAHILLSDCRLVE